jgi:DNA-binding NarL/FixJ family response regulator
MKEVLLYTKQSAILKHWNKALEGEYKIDALESQRELIEVLEDGYAGIILVDEDSLEVLDRTLTVLKHHAKAQLLFFKSVPDVQHAAQVVGGNIKGYENAFINKINLLEMIKQVEQGKNWLFSDLTHYIISMFIQKNESSEPSFISKLTPTQKEIAHMVANGLSNKEIAQAKGIALSTVKGHLQKIFHIAGVSDRYSLALAFKHL